ncbi:hypothetical protein V5P93_003583 [Actinokineospora auranticolor]|uniref:Uncharacterized protein n=1 Tax=Actinokineospora auranticolor TaxID=155976 RepID=A0A2S6GPX1_9PSEU|nr:hypothetical protein [Actinokineospora auranticolor]PPK67246.1 hypothetical protein CLV40_108245 [Actinokineospora auranticolor]
MSTLRVPAGSTQAGAHGANERGVAVGGDEHHALLWNLGGGPVELPNAPGGSLASASAVNNPGAVVGAVVLPDHTTHAARWWCERPQGA